MASVAGLPPGFEVVEDTPVETISGLPPGFEVQGQEPPIREGMGLNEGSVGPTAAVGALRSVPELAGVATKGFGRFIASRPAMAQKAINAGVTGLASATGGAIGGVPGAIAGGAVRGVAPSQMAIRETFGRMAGEAPAVAKQAGRAVGTVNFAKETTGLRLNPANVVGTGNAARAVDNYADSMGQRVVRILGPDGKVVVGPEAIAETAARKAPGLLSRGASSAMSGLSKVLDPLQGMTAMTDFAQTVEPNRHDIGIMGIGASQPQPTMAQAMEANKVNQQKAEAQYRALLMAQLAK